MHGTFPSAVPITRHGDWPTGNRNLDSDPPFYVRICRLQGQVAGWCDVPLTP